MELLVLLLTMVSYKLTEDRHEEEVELLNISDDNDEDATEVDTVVVILEEPGLLA